MKSIFSTVLAIWICLGSLMPMNDMEELAKVPDLIYHFQEHKAESGGDFSFFQFLDEHYGHGKQTQDQKHKKLPFFEHQCPGLVFLVSQFQFLLNPPLPLENREFLPFFEDGVHYWNATAWQPPRLG